MNKIRTIKAERKAFDAYNILYYPLFGKGGLREELDVEDAPAVTEEDCALALTVQENLSGTPYVLSERSLAALAQIYALLRESGAGTIVDPYEDIVSIVPESAPAKPMYPDFPTQVKDMSEEQFRTDQLIHYASTYGIEFLAKAIFDMDIEVKRGWLPDAEETAKTRKDGALADKHVIEIVASPSAMASIITSDLARPKRMPEPACAIAARLFAVGALSPVTVAFHENMMEVLRASSKESSAALEAACDALAQHPGDVLKAVLWCAEKDEQNHIATKAKKGFCRAIERFCVDDIAANAADLSRKGEKALNMLSIARFGGPRLEEAVSLLANGSVRSFASELERKWKAFDDGKDPNASELLRWYERRPGVMLRSIARMMRHGVPFEEIKRACSAHAGELSIATLIQVANAFTALDTGVDRDWTGRPALTDEERARREANAKIAGPLSELALELLSARLREIETPLARKNVLVDPTGFSLAGSVVLPNETSNTSGAYPPSGMAYDVPADKTVRFFTFWNDQDKRVDVDLHFNYTSQDGTSGSIGWNSHYNHFGMTTSGDITHSDNAAEYLDIDMEEARKRGVETVFQRQHIYSGASDWHDIGTCFSGALVVGDTAPDVALYNSENILFHDDLEGEGRNMLYAMVDVPGHYVRILRGTNVPFSRNAFTLASYIGLLLAAQRAVMVDDIADADVVLSVGRNSAEEVDGVPVVSLVDNGFFIE